MGSQSRRNFWLVLLLAVGLAGFIVVSPTATLAVRPAAAQATLDGEAIYLERCAFCHGENGDGDGPVAPYLNPRPRDFTSGQFKFRTTASGELPLREDVIHIVQVGVRSTAMPAWEGVLTEAEIEAVVDYLTQNFVPDWGEFEPVVIPVGNPPRVTAAIIAEGEQIYQELQCWKCHGQAGRADGPSAPTLTDDFDFPIRAADLTKAWRYKGGSELIDIYSRFSTGLNGTPMPSFYDVFPEEEREEKLWALSAYVYSLQAQQPTEQSVITAGRIAGSLPTSPEAPEWNEVEAVSLFLTGQVITGPRWQTPGVDAVTVRALHNDESLALLVEWSDPFQDAAGGGSEGNVGNATYVNLDEFLGTAGPQPDALAVQFPQTVTEGTQKPYFFWGQPGQPVNLWRWQADSSVAEYNVAGFREEWQPQESSQVTAEASWADGQYRLLFTRPLTTTDPNDVQLVPGEFIPIAFQAWEGSNGEAGTRLALSSWYSLVLEKPAPVSVYLYTVLTVGLVAAGEWLLVRRARRK
ncbi:MAG: ethylbenzene dehydrogenase-related protein [Chloroflexi bacterium]|nr:ethylbenzene dehydrogenase-related protein [Chloroflexota bacterium]MCI0580696.1 ethylbenzene dehydrogenase-related protein [Chloroflexota bacterium]MCI0648573.1 ethylbenzene dehydrogenase-related protein [Chloroflexota bacterium]MCI0727336.1 ethylbenzene dehydrogenase-related protein [Chloroflexota bacterium]